MCGIRAGIQPGQDGSLMARFKKPVRPPFGIQPAPARRDGPSPCVTGVAAFRNGGIRDDSGGGGSVQSAASV